MKNETGRAKSKWIRMVGIGCGSLLLLLAVAYFIATSAGFLKRFILPWVSQATGATITVEAASISPFSAVSLSGIKVQTSGGETLFAARQVSARYNLMAILRGNIRVDEVVVDEPLVKVVMNADGTSNLDGFTRPKTGEGKKPAPSQPSVPPQIDIKRIAFNNAQVHFARNQTNGVRTLIDLDGASFSIEGLKNGQTAKLNLASRLKYGTGVATNLAEVAATIKGSFALDLGEDLMPRRVGSETEVTIASASGAFSDAARLDARLVADLSMTEIKQVALSFGKDGKALGAITASGPFDLAKQEGNLKVRVTGIGNELLSLVGGGYGFFFASTQIAASYDLDIRNQARTITTVGTVTADKFSLSRSNLTTPTLDVQLNYDLTVDLPKTNAVIRTFALSATQGGRPLLKSGLSREMALDWSKGAEAVAESSFELTVSELNLADWRAFLGTNLESGVVGGRLVAQGQKAGRLIVFDLGSQLAGLTAQIGTNRIDRGAASLALHGTLTDFAKVDLTNLNLTLAQASQPVLSLKGAGQFDTQTQDADVQAEIEAALARATGFLTQPGLNLASGTMTFTGHVTQKNRTPKQAKNPSMDRTVAGHLRVTDLTGVFASNRFDRFEAAADVDAAVSNNLAEIHKCSGSLGQAGQPGGGFSVSGSYDLSNQVGGINLKLEDLNQNVLRSFLAASLGDMALAGVSINADASARRDREGAASVQGRFEVANLLITDPQGRMPQVPMTAEVRIEATLSGKGVAEIRQLNGTVRQGDKPAGRFEASGQYDLTNQVGQALLKLDGLNQDALAPLLGPSLGDKKLESVSINASAQARLEAKGRSTVKADLGVTRLLLSNPAGSLPKTPLAASAQVEAAMENKILDLREFKLALAPTARAKNELLLAGRLDLSKSNAISGNLKLSAEALDLTPSYDMFAGLKGTNQPGAGKSAAAAAGPAPASTAEPAAVKLPLRAFTLETEIGRVFLREMTVTNLVAKTTIDDGKVEVNPFHLTLNGAPVSGRALLNLGVPGYQYDVSLRANRLPLEPILTSFELYPAGQFQGDLLAEADIKGAGITGPSLRKNLSGQAGLTLTNANLQTVGPTARRLITPVAAVLRLDELLSSPLNWIDLKTEIGAGQIKLQRFMTESPAFQAQAAGRIDLADILTNSVIQPMAVNIALRRALAEKSNLVPEGTPTNTPYVSLPSFVKVLGTVGEPKVDTDKLVLAGLTLKSVAGLPLGTNESTKGLLNSLGQALTGPSTNKAATNAPQGRSVLDDLLGPGSRSPATNQGQGTNPPPKKQRGLFDILK
jgi:hypothetical protein